MTTHRVVWKLLASGAACSAGIPALAIVRSIGFFLRANHDRREDRLIRAWAKLMARILGMRVSVSGPLPRGAFLLVSNHLSYIDVFAFMSQVDARLLSKAEVKSWPLLGPLANFAGTLFVDRARRKDLQRVITEIESTLKHGRGVLFFPEGTSGSGMEVHTFKPSLFEVAAQGGFEVCTAALTYVCQPGERPAQWSVSWWGDMPFLPHLIGALRLSSFEAKITFSEQRLSGSDRKQLASEAHAAVTEIFVPVCTELGEDTLFHPAN
jgi:1-acyl-sn-glycerol-3-phosphate acyltransferase